MANIATITLTVDEAAGNLSDLLVNSNPQLMLSNLQNYAAALASGNRAGSIDVAINTGDAVAASGTLTLSSVAAGDDATIGLSEIDAVDAKEQTQITAVADIAGSLASTYFNFSDASDTHKYYAWYKVGVTGTDPAVAGRIGIEVDISSGATANAVALASRTAISAAASSYITVSGATDKIVLRNKSPGLTTDAADGTAATGFTFLVQNQGAAVAADEFDIGASDAEGASNLADAINAQASLSGIASASADAEIVTVTASVPGAAGNQIDLAASGGISAGDSHLSGGSDNTEITSYNFQR